MQDEQKKTVVVGLLFVVMIGVGAFQFQKLSPPSQVAPATSPHHVVASPDKTSSSATLLSPPEYAERDPFLSPVSATEPTPASFVPSAPITGKNLGLEPSHSAGPIKGEILPATSRGGALTDPRRGVAPAVNPQPEQLPKLSFPFRLGGVIMGAKQLAVFVDPSGSQRLIAVGAAIDPDSKLVSVTRTDATVLVRGKRLRITLGGDPLAK